MFPELQDYGLIFVSLAVFGFIISDIFKTGQYWGCGIPSFYKSNIEKFFHYVSTAILFLSLFLVFIGLAPQENAITKFIDVFFTAFYKIHESGILSDGSYIIIEKIFVISSFFAFIYIFLYAVLFLSGFYLRLGSHEIQLNQLNVFLRNQCEPIKFAAFVAESNDFFFFLKKEGINLWEAVRKEDIKRIETIKASSQLENCAVYLINRIFSFKNKIRIRGLLKTAKLHLILTK